MQDAYGNECLPMYEGKCLIRHDWCMRYHPGAVRMEGYFTSQLHFALIAKLYFEHSVFLEKIHVFERRPSGDKFVATICREDYAILG